jgi:hypothetical protein
LVNAVELFQDPPLVGHKETRRFLPIPAHGVYDFHPVWPDTHSKLPGRVGLNDSVVDHAPAELDLMSRRVPHYISSPHQPSPTH